jgi:hypothetical protein
MFMGVADHPDSFVDNTPGADNSLAAKAARFPPRVSPTGLGNRRGCIYDNQFAFGGRIVPLHAASMKDIGSPKQIFMMDKWYSELQTGFYYDYGPSSAAAVRLVSNHAINRQSVGPPSLVFAAGVNVLLADGSVRWMDTRSEKFLSVPRLKVRYHYDYIYQFYVDKDLDPLLWPKR